MKMENTLRAMDDGVIARVLVQECVSLEADQPILQFE